MLNHSPSRGSLANNPGLAWTNSAIDLLYEFTKCSKLQFDEDGDSDDIRKSSSFSER